LQVNSEAHAPTRVVDSVRHGLSFYGHEAYANSTRSPRTAPNTPALLSPRSPYTGYEDTVGPGNGHDRMTQRTTLVLVELRPWLAASPAEVNDQVGAKDAEQGLVVDYRTEGLPHALEIEQSFPTNGYQPVGADRPPKTIYPGGIVSKIVRSDGMAAQAGRLRAKIAIVGWKADGSSRVPA
jgi:hypothetical protein